MKVCHFTTVHPRNDGRVFYKQCISCVKNGIDTVLVVADGKGDSVKEGVNIIDIGLVGKNKLVRIAGLKRKLFNRLIEIDADIYEFHDPELLHVGKKLKNVGKKVIYDSHEDAPKQILYKKWLGALFFRKLVSREFNIYEKRVVKQLDGLISVIDEITNKFECKQKVTIKNYPITDIFRSSVVDFEKKKKQFIYVGSISEERGVLDYINALSYFPHDYSLVLLGTFSSHKFEKTCRQHTNWSRVIYKGFVQLDQLPPLIAESLVGLSVLHAEENYLSSLPTKGFEYISSGTPLIYSAFAYWEPYFNGCGLSVEPNLAEQIAQKIKELINTKESYTNYQQKGLEKSGAYSWESESVRLIQFYKNIHESN
jgi:glycosyltransferase involved in cell wall biosynthesis